MRGSILGEGYILTESDWRLGLDSTACWRRYQGTWEIVDDKIYLIELRGCYKIADSNRLHACWFSGEISIPDGPRLEPNPFGLRPTYEQEIRVRIEQGVVVASHVIDNRESEEDWMRRAPKIPEDWWKAR